MRNENKNYSRLVILPFFALISVFWIVGQKYLNTVSLIFGTFGIFIGICLFLHLISLFLGRNNKVVSGTCISSDFNRILDNRGVIIAEYWQNVFEYFENGTKRTVSLKSNNQITVGSVKKLNIGKNITVLQKNIDEAKSKKNTLTMVYLFLGSFAGVFVSEYIWRNLSVKQFHSELLVVPFSLLIGIIFTSIGSISIKSAVIDSQKIKEAEPIKAKILGYIEHCSSDSDGTYHYSYFPKYEYTYRGRTQVYQSNVSTGKRKQIGDTEDLYISDDKVIEKRGIKAKKILGTVFFTLGLAVIVMALIFWTKKI